MELITPIIVDTNFLSDYLAGRPAAKVTMRKLLQAHYYCVTTAITVAELWFGQHRRRWQEKRTQALARLIASLKVFPFTEEHAVLYGQVRATLMDRGEDIGFADTVIAAIALKEQIALLTADIDDFKRIEGLKLLPYHASPRKSRPSGQERTA